MTRRYTTRMMAAALAVGLLATSLGTASAGAQTPRATGGCAAGTKLARCWQAYIVPARIAGGPVHFDSLDAATFGSYALGFQAFGEYGFSFTVVGGGHVLALRYSVLKKIPPDPNVPDAIAQGLDYARQHHVARWDRPQAFTVYTDGPIVGLVQRWPGHCDVAAYDYLPHAHAGLTAYAHSPTTACGAARARADAVLSYLQVHAPMRPQGVW